MRMSGKEFLKSWRRKVYSDWEDVTSSGMAFQVFRPANVTLVTVERQVSQCLLLKHSYSQPLLILIAGVKGLTC